MRTIITIAAFAALSATPALAQVTKPAGTVATKAQCLANFDAADANNDGMLNSTEIDRSRRVIPTNLGAREEISKTDFVKSCNALAKRDTP